MIQDIAPKKLHNEYHPAKPDGKDYIAVFSKNKILIKQTGAFIELPRRDELEDFFGCSEDISACLDIYLFCIDEDAYFLYAEHDYVKDDWNLTKTEFRWAGLPEVRNLADHELCYAVYTANHLYQWYKNSRFCGRCGAATVPDSKERMLYCPVCGNQIYPRISPAVIVAVTNDDKILLTKYANREYKRYALIAGFTEIGETAEDTVRREVMEETGVRVKNIRYYKSQPWGIDGNLLFGYFAELDGSDHITMDEGELSSAEWVSWEKLKGMDDAFSLTREMMRVFYENHAVRCSNLTVHSS